MKRVDQLNNYRKMSLADLKGEVEQAEKQIQTEKMAIAFNKSKQVKQIRQLKRQLARLLTLANQKLTITVPTDIETGN